MILETVPDGHQYHACCRCSEPNTGTRLLFHYRDSFHEPDRLWNDPACPDCTELFKQERGRTLLVQKAPKLMQLPDPDAPNLNAPPVRDCDYWKQGHRDWLDAIEHERYLDDLDFDAMSHDRG